MGDIFSAYDEQLDRKVAIKLVRSGGHGAEVANRRMLREAQTLAQLSHPNVVQVYDVGTYQDRVFIAMELIRGMTLRDWLDSKDERAQPRRQREILDQFIEVGRGLQAAHQAGLTHRDFKPDNVLIGAAGRPRVADFGLARIMSEASSAHRVEPDHDERPASPGREVDRGLTAQGAVMGTPAYMAPEQMSGNQADNRSDQYSFCLALYEALYREQPFAERDFDGLHRARRSGLVAVPPAEAQVPRSIHDALVRGLAPARDDRFADMAGLLDALEKGQRGWHRRWLMGLLHGRPAIRECTTIFSPARPLHWVSTSARTGMASPTARAHSRFWPSSHGCRSGVLSRATTRMSSCPTGMPNNACWSALPAVPTTALIGFLCAQWPFNGSPNSMWRS